MGIEGDEYVAYLMGETEIGVQPIDDGCLK